MRDEYSVINKKSRTPVLRSREYCKNGSGKKIKVKKQGEVLGNATFWTRHSLCNHELTAAADVCIESAQEEAF